METNFIEELVASNAAYGNILTRTSVRRYTSQPVSPDERDAILHAAMSAPSGVNRQPWELVVVDDPNLLDALAGNLPYARMVAHAPMAIVVCGNRDRFLDGDDSTLWIQDISAVSENILLAAHSLGLGGVWTCIYPHSDRVAAARSVLNLPGNLVPFSLIPVGHPASNHAPMDKWHPDRVHFNKF